MTYYLIKLLLSAVTIVVVSELAKRFTLLGSLIASLPLTSLLAILWLYVETRETEKIASLSTGIFWLVLPSLPLFLILPTMLRAGVNFWLSLGSASAATVALYFIMMVILRRLGIET